MLAAETQQIEGILYGLLRAHHERADMAWRMAERAAGTAEGERLLRRAREYEEDAELVRKLLVAQSNSDIPEGEVI
jgi:hypothetical protein